MAWKVGSWVTEIAGSASRLTPSGDPSGPGSHRAEAAVLWLVPAQHGAVTPPRAGQARAGAPPGLATRLRCISLLHPPPAAAGAGAPCREKCMFGPWNINSLVQRGPCSADTDGTQPLLFGSGTFLLTRVAFLPVRFVLFIFYYHKPRRRPGTRRSSFCGLDFPL